MAKSKVYFTPDVSAAHGIGSKDYELIPLA